MTHARFLLNTAQDGARKAVPAWMVLVAAALVMGAGAIVSLQPLLAALLAAAVGGIAVFLWAAYRPVWLLYALVLFMPFENIVLKFLPVSARIYTFARFGSEFAVYLAFAVLVSNRLITNRPLRRTPLDWPLVIFFGLAALSILINRAITIDSIANLRALLRYVVLFYWVANLNLEPSQARRVLQLILFTALLQVLIGALQRLSGGALDPILTPRATAIELAGQTRVFRLTGERGREHGAIFGTLGDTLYFGLFMLIALAVYLGRVRKLNLTALFVVAAIVSAIAYSYSRAATFGIALVFGLFIWLRHGPKKLAVLLLALSPLVLVAAAYVIYLLQQPQEFLNPTIYEQSVVENLTGVFSTDYVNRAYYQRLGILLGATPAVLASKPILGYGPSVNQVIETINATQAEYLFSQLQESNFEDVYWVAILTYYGILGFAAFTLLIAAMFISAVKTARTARSPLLRQIAIAAAGVVGLAPFLLFFYRVLEFRIFGFYFWLLPGLLYAAKAAVKRHNPEPSLSSVNGVRNSYEP